LKLAHIADEYERYLVLAEGVPVIIGSAYGCTIALADSNVAPQHLRVTLHGNEIVIETIRPQYPTGWSHRPGEPPPPGLPRRVWVDDVEAPIYQPITVGIDHTIRIGETLIQLEYASVAPRARVETMPQQLDQAELDMLAKLAADPIDDATREIYADWLEGHGFPLRAAFVRLELEGGADITTCEPLARMVGASTVEWRAAISRTPIRHCYRKCAQSWHQLAPTSMATEPDAPAIVRHCATCRLDVPYCARGQVVPAGHRSIPVAYDAELDHRSSDELYLTAVDEANAT